MTLSADVQECVRNMDDGGMDLSALESLEDVMDGEATTIEIDGWGTIEMEEDSLYIRIGAQKLAASAIAAVVAGMTLY